MRVLLIALLAAISYAQTVCCNGGSPCDLSIVPETNGLESESSCASALSQLGGFCTGWLEIYCPVSCNACPTISVASHVSQYSIIKAPVPESTECTSFTVGSCPCDPGTQEADFYFVMDASSTIPKSYFDQIKMTIADSFETYYAAFDGGVRYSLISYSNVANYLALHTSDISTMADAFRNMNHIGGGTWNRRALESVFSTYNAHRDTYVLMFTDGSEQIESMALCDGDDQTEIVAKLLRAGIVIQPMLLTGGDFTPSGVSCIPEEPILVEDSATPYDMYFTTDCMLHTEESDYSGTYIRAGMNMGKNKYWDVENDYWAMWTGDSWEFTGLGLEPMVEMVPGLGGYRPVNASDYMQGATMYTEMHICCSAKDPFDAFGTSYHYFSFFAYSFQRFSTHQIQVAQEGVCA